MTVKGAASGPTVRLVDRHTRQLHAWQERVALVCLLPTVAVALLVAWLVRGEDTPVIGGALLTDSMTINLVTQLRRRP